MRSEIKWFAEQMEKKLKACDGLKPHWRTQTIPNLIKCLDVEFEELMGARNEDDIILEAVDVANYAMMIADVANMTVPETPRDTPSRAHEMLKVELKLILNAHQGDTDLCADRILHRLKTLPYTGPFFTAPLGVLEDG